VAGASAYSRTIDWRRFREIADSVGARFMADMAHIAGLVATGLHPSPVPHADAVTTTTHKTLRGPRGGLILCKEEHAKVIDKAMFPGTQGGPLEHVIAAKAVSFKEALEPSFKVYCRQIIANAQALASAISGYGFEIVSGGTDNHLMLVDLRSRNLTGKVAEKALDVAGITVNTVAPGFIATEMLENVPEKVLDKIRSQIPVRRLCRPEEIARVVHFLAADASAYITGQCIPVDGGFLAQ